jgi:hypothetical protein
MFNLRSLFVKKEQDLVGIVVNVTQLQEFDNYNNIKVVFKSKLSNVSQKFKKKVIPKIMNEILFLKVRKPN